MSGSLGLFKATLQASNHTWRIRYEKTDDIDARPLARPRLRGHYVCAGHHYQEVQQEESAQEDGDPQEGRLIHSRPDCRTFRQAGRAQLGRFAIRALRGPSPHPPSAPATHGAPGESSSSTRYPPHILPARPSDNARPGTPWKARWSMCTPEPRSRSPLCPLAAIRDASVSPPGTGKNKRTQRSGRWENCMWVAGDTRTTAPDADGGRTVSWPRSQSWRRVRRWRTRLLPAPCLRAPATPRSARRPATGPIRRRRDWRLP